MAPGARMLHLQKPEVDDLVEDLVSAFREGLVHFIEELDAKLQFEFQSLEQKEGQLRIERQALDELRKALREENAKAKETGSQKLRFADPEQLVSPALASDFLVRIPEAPKFQRQSVAAYCTRAPKPWEVVTIAGRDYATLPPKCPHEEDRERLKNWIVALPEGWELLETNASENFAFIMEQLGSCSWGNPLLAVQCSRQPRLFSTYRTRASSGKPGSRYRTESRHAVALAATELPSGAAQGQLHLRICHEFGRLVIQRKAATE